MRLALAALPPSRRRCTPLRMLRRRASAGAIEARQGGASQGRRATEPTGIYLRRPCRASVATAGAANVHLSLTPADELVTRCGGRTIAALQARDQFRRNTLWKRSWQEIDACSSSVAVTLSSVTGSSASITASRRDPSREARLAETAAGLDAADDVAVAAHAHAARNDDVEAVVDVARAQHRLRPAGTPARRPHASPRGSRRGRNRGRSAACAAPRSAPARRSAAGSRAASGGRASGRRRARCRCDSACPGSFCSARVDDVSRSSGISGRIVRSGSALLHDLPAAACRARRRGTAAGRSAFRTSRRRANTGPSARRVSRPCTCSGDMYAGLPATPSSREMSESATSAMPKSTMRTSPSCVSRMFDGLMSRCTTPRECA